MMTTLVTTREMSWDYTLYFIVIVGCIYLNTKKEFATYEST